MMTGQPLSPTLALVDQPQPKRSSSNAEVKSPHTVQAAKVANGGQSSRMPTTLKQTKSVGKNLLLSPENQKSAMKQDGKSKQLLKTQNTNSNGKLKR